MSGMRYAFAGIGTTLWPQELPEVISTGIGRAAYILTPHGWGWRT